MERHAVCAFMKCSITLVYSEVSCSTQECFEAYEKIQKNQCQTDRIYFKYQEIQA